MQSNNTAAHLLQPARPGQKVELVFEDDGRVALRYCTWTEGLGWCTQKTICLSAEQLEELHRAVTVARHRVRHRLADAEQLGEPAQVIQLPTLT